MIIGPLHVRIARSMWAYRGATFIDGRHYEPLLMRMIGDTTLVYGRGGVFALGPWMLWWQWETHRAEIEP